MAPSILRQCRIVTHGQYKSSWTVDKIKKWVEAAGGVFHSKLQEDTTHLVVTQGGWEIRGPLVLSALEASEQGRDIKIVGYEWLEECLTSRCKKREAAFMWHKSTETIDLDAEDDKSVAPGKRSGAKALSSRVGAIREVFDDSTAHYLDSKTMKRLDKQREAEERAQSEKDEVLRNARKQLKIRIDEDVAYFKQGAVRGRNEAFSDIYHIYVDPQGFPYDVLLTKVDVLSNSNQRLCLTIFESNVFPSSYAFNANLKQSYQRSNSDMIVSLGSNWDTAFNAFKKEFREKTGYGWQDPLLAASDANHQAGKVERGMHRCQKPTQTCSTGQGWVYQVRHCVSANDQLKEQRCVTATQVGRPENSDVDFGDGECPAQSASSLPDTSSMVLDHRQPHPPNSQTIEIVDLDDDVGSNQHDTTHDKNSAYANRPGYAKDDIAISLKPHKLGSAEVQGLNIHKIMRCGSEPEDDQNGYRVSHAYNSLALGNSLLGKRKMAITQDVPHKRMSRVASEPI